MSKRQRTVGQETGIESNPVAPDNRNGQLDSAGVGNQSTHESPGMVVPVVTSSRLNQARLRQALSSIGQASDAVQSLFSGPTSGRTSEQDTVESSDSRERRWLPAKPAKQESSDVFGRGNASVRLERSTDPYVTTEQPSFKPGQGAKASTKGDADQ